MATLKTFRVVSRVGPVTPRLSRGLIAKVDIVAVARVEVGPRGP